MLAIQNIGIIQRKGTKPIFIIQHVIREKRGQPVNTNRSLLIPFENLSIPVFADGHRNFLIKLQATIRLA